MHFIGIECENLFVSFDVTLILFLVHAHFHLEMVIAFAWIHNGFSHSESSGEHFWLGTLVHATWRTTKKNIINLMRIIKYSGILDILIKT